MKQLRGIRARIQSMAIKHPQLGPSLWILSIQYFVAQVVVAAAWPTSYSWANHYISDLGNTACGDYAGLYVCSPLAPVMNASFIIFGVSMMVGSVLIYERFRHAKLSLPGFALMAVSGIGTIMVGLFPENNPNGLHMVGAFLGLAVGNVSIVILGITLKGMIHPLLRTYTILSGAVSLAAFGLFIVDVYLGIGRGGMERLISYPFTVWMIIFGLYLVHARKHARR